MAKKRASKSKTKRSVSKTVTAKVTAPAKATVSRLHLWNIVAAIVLLAQAVAILILSNATSLPVTTHYLTKDDLASQVAGHTVMAQAVRHLFDVRLAWLLAALLLIAAIMHALFATILRQRYDKAVNKRANGWRWATTAVSVSLMFVALLMINGMYDAVSLLMLIALVAIIQLLGYGSEVLAALASPSKWRTYWAMFAAGVVVWLTIGSYLKDALMYGVGLPHFVYWLDGSVLIVALLLAANKFFVVRAKGRWADYVYGERLFTLLIVAALSAVTWQVYFGALH